MTLERALVDALDRTAAGHHPEPPDLRAVREGGRRRARRRTLVRVGVGVAAALVVLGGLAPVLLGGDAEPAPAPASPSLAELPLGAPPAVPYCADGRTVVDGDVEVRARCDVLVTRGGATLYLGSRRGVEQLVDGRRVLLDRSGAEYWFPAVSVDGHWAAWLTAAGPGAHLVVADLERSTVVRRVPWPSANGWVPGIDDLGRAYTVDFDTTEVVAYDLRTDEALPVTGTPEHGSPGIRFVTGDGFGILPGNPVGPVVVGSVTVDGRFVRSHETSWNMLHHSPDRSRVVRDDPSQGLVVSATDATTEDVRLRLPERGSAVWIPVWETEDTVLVQFDPYTEATEPLGTSNGLDVPAARTTLLRCSADDGDCEVALPPGWGGDMTYPVYR
jgi:hypothetical protein